MSDSRATVGFFDDDVLAFGAESDFDGIVKLFGAGEDLVASLISIKDFFSHFMIPYLMFDKPNN